MKLFFSFLLVIFFAPYFSLKAQDINFNNYFFDNQITFYSLSNFIETDNITVYDEGKRINETQYKYQKEKVNQEIKIVHSIPKIEKYLILSDYIINDNLAVISFADSKKKKYIIYTFKRSSKEDKWWSLLSIYDGSMN